MCEFGKPLSGNKNKKRFSLFPEIRFLVRTRNSISGNNETKIILPKLHSGDAANVAEFSSLGRSCLPLVALLDRYSAALVSRLSERSCFALPAVLSKEC